MSLSRRTTEVASPRRCQCSALLLVFVGLVWLAEQLSSSDHRALPKAQATVSAMLREYHSQAIQKHAGRNNQHADISERSAPRTLRTTRRVRGNAVATSTPQPLGIGSKVRIHSLIHDIELNGKTGTAVFKQDRRFYVRFDNKHGQFNWQFRQRKTFKDYTWLDYSIDAANLEALQTKKINIASLEETMVKNEANWILGFGGERFAPFYPAYEYKKVPEGSPVEAGLEITMDLHHGGNKARIPWQDTFDGVSLRTPPEAT